MRFRLVLLIFGISVQVGQAQESALYRSCNQTAQTQFEMEKCANEEAQRVNIELNKTYRDLLRSLSQNPNAVTKVKAAERAWLVYRDAFIEAMYPATNKQKEYGSIYPMEVDLLEAKLTREHIEAIRELSRSNQQGP